MTPARPILMSGPMVRSTIEGIKTQTRRTVKLPPWSTGEDGDVEIDERGIPQIIARSSGCFADIPLRYKPGNLLWVRESIWQASPYPGTDPSGEPDESGRWSSRLVHYAGDGEPPNCANRHYGPTGLHNGAFAAPDPYAVWLRRPAIHMPRWASRLTLELTDVRVERLQDMEGQHPSESDAIAEGVNKIHHGDGAYYYSAFRNEPHPKNWCDPTDAFRELWEKLNGNGSWDLNPWVWVLSFKVHHANVDAVLAQRAEVAA